MHNRKRCEFYTVKPRNYPHQSIYIIVHQHLCCSNYVNIHGLMQLCNLFFKCFSLSFIQSYFSLPPLTLFLLYLIFNPRKMPCEFIKSIQIIKLIFISNPYTNPRRRSSNNSYGGGGVRGESFDIFERRDREFK